MPLLTKTRNHPDKVDSVTGKLLGKYVFRVQDLAKLVNKGYANCPTFEVHPDADWVENNIQAQYLATAQKIACDHSWWFQTAGQKNEKHGFVDVLSLNLEIPIHNDP